MAIPAEPSTDPAGPPAALPWERQPGETAAHYKLFQRFLGAGWSRELKATAEAGGKTYEHVRKVARDNGWTERADAYDDSVLERFADNWIEVSLKSFERDQQMLLIARSKVLEGIRNVDMSKPKPGDVARFMDVFFRHSRLLFGNPLQILAGADTGGDGGGEVSGDVRAFAEMNRAQRDRVLADMREALAGKSHARSGKDDE